MPKCKFNDSSLHSKHAIKEFEALTDIARILSLPGQEDEILLAVIDVLQEIRSVTCGTITLRKEDNRALHAEERSTYRDERSRSHLSIPIAVDQITMGTLSVDCTVLPDEEFTQFISTVALMIANHLTVRRRNSLEQQTLINELTRLRANVIEKVQPEEMIGNSHRMQEIYTRIHQVSSSDTPVLIRGESGTGKALAAASIHDSGSRAKNPFIKINCAELNKNLLERELFGHENGDCTEMRQSRSGRIEEAEGGTLFLDEIGAASPSVQAKLLRLLQENSFERVGSNQPRKADVRYILATHIDLETSMLENRFRQDLFHRINAFPIHLPALRARREDILLLTNFFLKNYAGKLKAPIVRISTSAINMLMAYHWPGNVRELENTIEYAVLMSRENGVIHGHDLPPTLQTPIASSATGNLQHTLKARVAMLERDLIVDSLKRRNGTISAAARELGITERMVRYKIQKLNIDYENLFKNDEERK